MTAFINKKNLALLLVISGWMTLVFIRLPYPATFFLDAASQLEAAHNLTQGKGYSVFGQTTTYDLATPPEPGPFSQFPVMPSMIIALGISMGIDPGLYIKTLCYIFGLLGWLGWYFIMARWINKLSGLRLILMLVMCFLCPILMSFPVSLHHTIFCSVIPWFILLLNLLINSKNKIDLIVLSLIIGILSGFSYTVRYSSVILIPLFMATIILCVNKNIRSKLFAAVVFVFGFSVLYYFNSLFITKGTPGYFTERNFIDYIEIFLKSISTAGYISVGPAFIYLPSRLLFIIDNPIVTPVIGWFLLIFCAFVLVYLLRKRGFLSVGDDRTITWIILLCYPALFFMLAVASTRIIMDFNFLSWIYYFVPFYPCILFLFYFFIDKVSSKISVVCSLLFVCLLTYQFIDVFRSDRVSLIKRFVISPALGEVSSSTSSKHIAEYPASKSLELYNSLRKIYPEAVVLAEPLHNLYWNHENYGSRLRHIPEIEKWKKMFTSEDIQIIAFEHWTSRRIAEVANDGEVTYTFPFNKIDNIRRREDFDVYFKSGAHDFGWRVYEFSLPAGWRGEELFRGEVEEE